MTTARGQDPNGIYFRLHPAHPFFPQEMVVLNEFAATVDDWLAQADRDWYVDEVAVIMDSRATVGSVLPSMVANQGIEYFNNAVDTVTAWPFGGTYKPEYHFFRTPYPWRIELLRLPDGGSPVHAPYATQDNVTKSGLLLVHFSFKCDSKEEYEEAHDWLNKEAVLAQSCESTYGRFAYWRSPALGKKMAYVKPRVNLRDGGGVRPARIDHSSHNHPSTPQDRAVCREMMRREAALPVPHEPPAYPAHALHWGNIAEEEQS